MNLSEWMQYTAVEFGRIKTKFPFIYQHNHQYDNWCELCEVTRKVTSEAWSKGILRPEVFRAVVELRADPVEMF